MTTLFILVAIAYFFLELFLTLRSGSDHPIWSGPVFLVSLFVVVFIGDPAGKPGFPAVLLWIILVPISTRLISFPILRRRAGKLILAYQRTARSIIGTIFGVAFFFFMSFAMIFLYIRNVANGEMIYDRVSYFGQLPFSIAFGVIGLFMIPTIFRKGEFFENGIATPDMQYFLWSGYRTYQWVENNHEKADDRFSLVLRGGRNWPFAIHGFSSDRRDVLDGLLSTKLTKKS